MLPFEVDALEQNQQEKKFFAKILVLHQDKFESLEGTKGSFLITVCCEKVQKISLAYHLVID